jgi:hypothetical protein
MEEEKNIQIIYWRRNLKLLLAYWSFSAGIPFYFIFISSDFPALLVLFIFFVSPLVFYAIFKKAKFNTYRGKVIFVLSGIFVPYIFAYICWLIALSRLRLSI